MEALPSARHRRDITRSLFFIMQNRLGWILPSARARADPNHTHGPPPDAHLAFMFHAQDRCLANSRDHALKAGGLSTLFFRNRPLTGRCKRQKRGAGAASSRDPANCGNLSGTRSSPPLFLNPPGSVATGKGRQAEGLTAVKTRRLWPEPGCDPRLWTDAASGD